MTFAQREELDRQFYSHIAESKKERAQYAKDKIKGMEYGTEELSPSKERLVLILDAIDKWKTTFPFFINLPKVLGDGLYFFRTKLLAALVHGIGVFCFWATEQLVHDSNLVIACVMLVLQKIFEGKNEIATNSLYSA